MKKIFSLLVVVAMLASLSLIACADATNTVSIEVVETTAGIVATYYVTNPSNVAGFTASLTFPTALTTDKSYTLGTDFSACTVSPASKSGQVKFAGTFGTATEKYVTKSGKVEIISFPLTRGTTDETVYTSDSFGIGTGLYVAKVVLGDASQITNTANPGNYSAPVYTDNRAPAETFVNSETSEVSKETVGTETVNVVTCAGRVGAAYQTLDYGVEFAADSTVGGTRAQRYYGAKYGDTISNGAGGTTIFTFEGVWDGTFEIILQGVHAGTKNFQFFVGDDKTAVQSKVVTE